MDCKDLMVGDFVKHKGVTKIVDTVYLCSVSVHDPSEPWGVALSKLVHVDDIEPIPLTESIFEKNGFVRSERWHYYTILTDDGSRIYIQLCCGGGVEYVHICKHFDDLTIRDIDITIAIHYVHQLQHLLRLCGIEKEIEL